MTDNWIFYKHIDWDSDIKQAHIDTRDFHVITYQEQSEKMPDLEKILKQKERFFHTSKEVAELIDKYFVDSGGKRDYRIFYIDGLNDWFKYIRMFKTEHGWLICHRNYIALRKEILSGKVKQQYE